MSNNVTRPPADGGFFSSLSGDRVMRGTIARWAESTKWVDRDGLPLPQVMFVIGYVTVLRRWVEKRPDYITEHPLPDPKELNATIPVVEWEIGLDGKPRPPWQLTFVVYMVDLKTGALFTYANSTFGAMLCFNNLEEQIAVMRMLKDGEHVFPIVQLDQRPMKTAYGMKMRPHFQVVDWRKTVTVVPPGVSQSTTPQLAAPTPTAVPAEASAPSTASVAPTAPVTPTAATAASGSVVLDNTQPMRPVTVGELIADELPPWA
jgi:hypothetical protein